MKPRLQEHYDKALKASLMEEFGYKNVMEVPRLDKIVVNMGVGEAVADTKKIKSAVGEMALITGQQPVVNKAKTSVATFKLREGMPIGCKRPEERRVGKEGGSKCRSRWAPDS